MAEREVNKRTSAEEEDAEGHWGRLPRDDEPTVEEDVTGHWGEFLRLPPSSLAGNMAPLSMRAQAPTPNLQALVKRLEENKPTVMVVEAPASQASKRELLQRVLDESEKGSVLITAVLRPDTLPHR